MFRLLRLLISLALFVGFIWFGLNVPLGSKTLFGHFQAIFSSKETKDLVEGTKQAAKPVIGKVEHKLVPDAGLPLDHHNPAERKALRRTIRKHLTEQ